MRKEILFLVGLLAVLVLAACGSEDNGTSPAGENGGETGEVGSGEGSEEKAEWGYDGDKGPEYWGEIAQAYAACSVGMQQSPIDIPAMAPVNPGNLDISYGESAVNILNNGHTIQANYDQGSSVIIDGMVYDLVQFHFHAASENTFAGMQTPMEVHFVHANAEGGLAVIGVMLIEGAENEAYASVLNNMPGEMTAVSTIEGAMVNAFDMLPEDKSYYRFEGSLTTPPCSEGVKWHLMENTVELSAEQIAQFTAIFDNNFRPVQAMNDREFILVDSMADGDDSGDEKAEWGYDGDKGPEYWGEIAQAYAACSVGMQQSPIDIPTGAPVNPGNLDISYGESAVNILNNGHTIQANYDQGSSVIIDGMVYDLVQFHFHAASENTFAGMQTPMEVHFVHANAEGGLAVIGVMLEEGAENAAYASVLNNMPTEMTPVSVVEGATMNAMDMLPAEKSYYRFDGSLTTPPCSEGVKWHLMENTVELSAEQIAQFTAIFDNNFRPVQAMNDREFILVDSMADGDDSGDEKAEWGYDGDKGPEYWGEIAQAYAACSVGMQQSPIDIPTGAPVNPGNLDITYSESAVNILNNGHTIQANYDQGSSVIIDGMVYDLVQFHFHAASENTFAGMQTPMEVHFVHVNAEGGLAVIGVMLEEGAENDAYASVLNNMPSEMTAVSTVDGAMVNAMDMLPAEKSYYRFDGSLTTPPCSEGVKWHLMDNTVELSAEQIAQFTAIFDNNFRPVQAMNDREFIVVDDSADADGNGLTSSAGTDWFSVSPEHAVCANGLDASVIDMKVVTMNDLDRVVFSYGDSTIDIIRNSETVQIRHDEGDGIEIDGEPFELIKLEYITPSSAEGGSFYAREFFRLVYADASNDQAVACVFEKDYTE